MATIIGIIVFQFLIIAIGGVAAILLVLKYRRQAAESDRRAEAFKQILDDYENDRYDTIKAKLSKKAAPADPATAAPAPKARKAAAK